MDKEYLQVQLGALLHDIGKFQQRAKTKLKHEKLSQIFADSNLPEDFKGILSGLIYAEDANVKNYSRAAKIVHIADMLASGEREKQKPVEIGVDKIPLKSIFSRIILKEWNNPKQKAYLPMPLMVNRELFADDEQNIKSQIEGIYDRNDWDNFSTDIGNLLKEYDKNRNLDAYILKLFYLLKKYTFLIPSAAYVDVPDVSLFEHSKVACAIASCLYFSNSDMFELNNSLVKKFKEVVESNEYKNIEKNKLKELIEKKLDTKTKEILNKSEFLLISGDFSGIQDFIYTITSKVAAKTLKGRSFFLTIFTDIISQHITKRLKLPIVNILFCGGGHFYILAPKSKEKELIEIKREILQLLLDNFKGDLYLVMDWIDLCPNDFDMIVFSDKWKEVSEKVNKQKNKKFFEIINESESYETIFGPFEAGGAEINQCKACKKEAKELKNIGDEMEEILVCKNCFGFKELSKELKETESSKGIYSKLEEIWPNLFNKLQFDKTEFYINSTKEVPFKFIPGVPPGIMDFDELSKESIGLNKLAVLKMDIDNLGSIFVKGLKGKKTISRLSQLSSMLSLFFDGYINAIIQQGEYKENIYLVYAGGDDTFIIGPWNLIFDLAYDIYSEFREFTCNNEDITLSAGIAVIDAKYPIHKSAELAEESLSKAKDSGKNKICIFDEAFEWKVFQKKKGLDEIKKVLNDNWQDLSEFECLWHLKELLHEGLKKDKKIINRSVLQKIYNSTRGFKRILAESQDKKIDLAKLWRLGYYLRKELRDKNTAEYAETIVKLYENIVRKNVFGDGNGKKIKNIMFIPAAVRWAELLTRKKEE